MANDQRSAPDGYSGLSGSTRIRMDGAERTAPADPDEEVTVTIIVRRRPDGPALPGHGEFAARATGRRRPLSRYEFARRHGAQPQDLVEVADFARSRGLRVADTNAARRSVVVSGSVRSMNGAFGVDLGRYESADAAYRGREGLIFVPAHLADIIEGVFGLDNRPVARLNGDPVVTVPLTPPQVARLYNFPAGEAAGQTIGILSFGGGYRIGDVQQFMSALGPGFTAPTVRDMKVAGATNSPAPFAGPPTNSDLENLADICIASSVAQGADIAVYFAPGTQDGWVDALARAIHPDPGDPVPTVLSISWFFAGGDDGSTLASQGVSTGFVDAVDAAFHDAAIVGITVVVTSGDAGSYCNVPDGKAHVECPGSHPWALSVGGTTIGNVSGSRFTEITWNDTSFGRGKPAVTGGGISDRFDVPAWQQGANVTASLNDPAHKGRGVPDVAGNASAASGYLLSFSGLPQGSYGGTSVAAPLYAGLIAVLNARLPEPVGFLNPTLYALGASIFRDIDDGGNNSFTFTKADGTTATSPGYKSGPGWDACTGLGVVDGSKLLAKLLQISGHTVLGDTADQGPALASHNGRLYLAWKGSGNPQLNVVVSDDNGSTFGAKQVLADTTEFSPALASHNGQLYLAWTGQGDQHLNVAEVTRPPFSEDPLVHARELMAFAASLLATSQHETGTDPDALHDLQTAADALRGFDPPPAIQADYYLLLEQVLRALATALLAAGRTVDAGLVAQEGILAGLKAATVPGGAPMLAAPDMAWLASLLDTLGLTGDAVRAQQNVVDLLAGFVPSASEQLDYQIMLAEERHNLVVRLIDDHQVDAVAPAVPGILTAYRQYAALPQADVLRVARDLTDLDKRLTGIGLAAEAADTQQAAVDVLRGFTPAANQELDYQIAFAEARHNLILRLIGDHRQDEAVTLIPETIAAYQQYASAAGADLPRLRADLTQFTAELLAAGFTARSADAQQILDKIPAS